MTYIPGVCNISSKGRKKRLSMAIIFAFISIVSYIDLDAQYRFLVIVPIFISSISFLEFIFNFCAYYGIRGRHEDEKGGHYTNERYKAPDKRKSYKIIAAGMLIAVIITVLLI